MRVEKKIKRVNPLPYSINSTFQPRTCLATLSFLRSRVAQRSHNLYLKQRYWRNSKNKLERQNNKSNLNINIFVNILITSIGFGCFGLSSHSYVIAYTLIIYINNLYNKLN
nr:hypothetical protein [Lentinula edodes]